MNMMALLFAALLLQSLFMLLVSGFFRRKPSNLALKVPVLGDPNRGHHPPPPHLLAKLDGQLTTYPLWATSPALPLNQATSYRDQVNRNNDKVKEVMQGSESKLMKSFKMAKKAVKMTLKEKYAEDEEYEKHDKVSSSQFSDRWDTCPGGHCHHPPPPPPQIMYKIKKIYIPKPYPVIKHVPIIKRVPVIKYKTRIQKVPVFKKKIIIKKIKVPVKVKVPYIKIKKIKVPVIKKIKVPVIRKVIKFVPKTKKVKHVHVHKVYVSKGKKKKKKKMKKKWKKMKKKMKKKKMKKKMKKMMEYMSDECHDDGGYARRSGWLRNMLPDHCKDEDGDEEDGDEEGGGDELDSF